VPFDLDRSRQYWRFVPSGLGKHDTAALAHLPDAEVEALWNRAFTSRVMRYPEEDCFMQVMAPQLRDARVLSIGSGMGFHELYYARCGARVVCCDIVDTNLAVIRRMAARKRVNGVSTILSDGMDPAFGGPYDVAFIYGSLMAMPTEDQRALLAGVRRVLVPSGWLVLMLYTWKFAATTCGWTSPEQFDPEVFATASDPSVGSEACPWSDWHDDEKLLALAGPDVAISRRQLWQQGLFVWYTLQGGERSATPQPYFDEQRLLQADTVHTLMPADFRPVSAVTSTEAEGLHVQTGEEPFAYAAASPPRRVAGENAIRVEVTLASGGLSAGVLDVAKQTFVNSVAVTDAGRRPFVVPLPPDLSLYQIIYSNHRGAGGGSSSFTVHRTEAISRATVTDFVC
jgi:SAM-dependent methyltransferase